MKMDAVRVGRTYVKTADGATGLVRSMNESTGTVEVSVDGGEWVELPVAELTRTVNPDSRRVEIEGMPETRPTCQYCGRKFRIISVSTYVPGTIRVARRKFRMWNAYDNLFCTLTCARRFARDAFKAGYRAKAQS